MSLLGALFGPDPDDGYDPSYDDRIGGDQYPCPIDNQPFDQDHGPWCDGSA